MIETVVALLMFVNGSINEARIHEKNIDGSLSIKKLILE
jgi:hypothetical protein